LTKALGVVRELDVTMGIVNELAARDTLPRLALEEVRRHVVTERDERRAVMLKRLEQINLSKLDKRLHGVGVALAEAEREGWRDALASRLVKRSRVLAAAMADAGRIYAPDRLHAVRIAGKKLRYAMELASDAGVKSAAAPLRVLKRAQDDLGRLHDLQVLQTHVAAVQAAAPGRTPSRAASIISRARGRMSSPPRALRRDHSRCRARRRHTHGRRPQLAHRARSRSRALKMALRTAPTMPGRLPIDASRR
jgi:CHAD domain-containing protein